MPMAVAVGAADWLNLAALNRYPGLRIALSESGIGWIPYFMERADSVTAGIRSGRIRKPSFEGARRVRCSASTSPAASSTTPSA